MGSDKSETTYGFTIQRGFVAIIFGVVIWNKKSLQIQYMFVIICNIRSLNAYSLLSLFLYLQLCSCNSLIR